MTSQMHGPLFFEGVEVGQCWISSGPDDYETDIVNFAGLTGDYNPLHVDHEHCRATPYGKPIAHGMLGMSLVAGLGSNAPWMQTAAFVRILDWQFFASAFRRRHGPRGDRVHVQADDAKRRGMITWRRRLVNQHGESVQEGSTETLVLVDPNGPLARHKPAQEAYVDPAIEHPGQNSCANGVTPR